MIDLIHERKSVTCRSHVQNPAGFAASLFLTSLLFFWILVFANEPRGVREGLYRGGEACC